MEIYTFLIKNSAFTYYYMLRNFEFRGLKNPQICVYVFSFGEAQRENYRIYSINSPQSNNSPCHDINSSGELTKAF